jgi:hypothetical protein
MVIGVVLAEQTALLSKNCRPCHTITFPKGTNCSNTIYPLKFTDVFK